MTPPLDSVRLQTCKVSQNRIVGLGFVEMVWRCECAWRERIGANDNLLCTSDVRSRAVVRVDNAVAETTCGSGVMSAMLEGRANLSEAADRVANCRSVKKSSIKKANRLGMYEMKGLVLRSEQSERRINRRVRGSRVNALAINHSLKYCHFAKTWISLGTADT
jgi:hypothetical protein